MRHTAKDALLAGGPAATMPTQCLTPARHDVLDREPHGGQHAEIVSMDVAQGMDGIPHIVRDGKHECLLCGCDLMEEPQPVDDAHSEQHRMLVGVLWLSYSPHPHERVWVRLC